MLKVFISLALMPVFAHGAVKCVAPDGNVSFQDAPCTSGRTESLKLEPAQPVSELDQRISTALAAGRVVVGMTSGQVRRAWGSPEKINASVGSYGRREQWVYEYSGHRRQYLYLDNGVLTSFQTPE